jgi:hypothetical protein
MEHQVSSAAPIAPGANNTNSHKYTVTQSLKDFTEAAKQNFSTFLLSLIISWFLSILLFLIVGFAFLSSLTRSNQFAFGGFGFGTSIISIIMGFIILIILYALVYAFTLSCIAFSLAPEKYDLSTTLSKAASVTLRVAGTNALTAIVAIWPFIIVAMLPLLAVRSSGGALLSLLTIILGLAAIVWIFIAMLRYSLASLVAAFEPSVPVTQTLNRSKELLKNGGQWFLLKGFVLVIAIVIIVGVLTGGNTVAYSSSSSNSLTQNIIMAVVSIFIEGALVMLYFNRAHKRVHH